MITEGSTKIKSPSYKTYFDALNFYRDDCTVGTRKEYDKVHVMLDVRGCSDDEIEQLKEAISVAAGEILLIAHDLLQRGLYHGCPHSHLEVSILEYQEKVRCDDCAITIPLKQEMN